MKITAVKIHHVEWERGPYHWRDGIMPTGPTGRTALLRILTDEGIEGLSPCGREVNVDEIKYLPRSTAKATPDPGIGPALASRWTGTGSRSTR
jgi:hypothetical protein